MREVMNMDLEPAFTFGTLLSRNEEAAHFYDNCTAEQKQAILAQLDKVPDMEAFVRNLPSAAL